MCAGLMCLRPGPLGGVQVVAVVPLPADRLAGLQARHPHLLHLVCRAAAAWRQPGTPGCGVVELNGGWRARSLAELQAAVRCSIAPAPAPASPCASPAALPWAWHAPAPPPAPPQQQLKRRHDEVEARAWPAESTCSRSDSETGSSGGSGGRAQSALREAAASAPRCGRSHSCGASLRSTRPSAAAASTSASSTEEGGWDDGEEVCSAPKRRCLGSASTGGWCGAPAAAASPQPAPVPAVAPPLQQPLLPSSRLSAELPEFSEEEIELLQECLQLPPSPGPSQLTDGCAARAAASAASSPAQWTARQPS